MINRIAADFRRQADFMRDGEVALFRGLARSISAHSASVFIDETHGSSKANVKFNTCMGVSSRCEISDLLIVSIAGADKPVRATFWQAKKESRSEWVSSNAALLQIDFKAQFNQWDLLARRPVVSGVAKFCPPSDVLSSSPTAAIGSFGVFYLRNQSLELFYSVAEFIACRNPQSMRPTCIGSCFTTPYHLGDNAVLSRSSLEDFLGALFNFEVGTLLHPEISSHRWLIGYARQKANTAGSPIPAEFFSAYGDPPRAFDGSMEGDGLSVLFVVAEGGW